MAPERCKTIEITVEHQLQRPTLARIHDLEAARLPSDSLQKPQDIMAIFNHALEALNYPTYSTSAGDLVAIILGMVDAAGQQVETTQADLFARVRSAVFGYLEKQWC
jgi:hypothetical protein